MIHTIDIYHIFTKKHLAWDLIKNLFFPEKEMLLYGTPTFLMEGGK